MNKYSTKKTAINGVWKSCKVWAGPPRLNLAKVSEHFFFVKFLQSLEAVKMESFLKGVINSSCPNIPDLSLLLRVYFQQVSVFDTEKRKGVKFFKWCSLFTYNWITGSLAHQWRHIQFRSSINKNMRGRLLAFCLCSLLLEESQNRLVRRGFIWFHHRDDDIIPIII